MSKMTATERIITAAQGKEPDRVPVTVIGVDFIWAHLYGPDSMLQYARDARKLADVMIYGCRELGLDSVGCMPDVNILWEAVAEASGLDYPATYWKGFVAQQPHRLYEGHYLKDMTYGNPAVKTMKDALKLVPADPAKHGRLPVVVEAIALATRELKGEWMVGGSYGHPFDMGAILGWTQMLMAMKNDLPLWKAVEEVAIETCYRFAVAQIKAGAMGLGTLTQLPMFVGSEEFLKNPVWVHAEHPPELMERIHKEYGVGTILHACSWGPFEPGIEVWKKWLDHTPVFSMPDGGGADALVRAKRALAPATMQGNVPPVDVMLLGTPQDVENASKELIKKCGPGGRFVLCPGCDLAINVPMENLKALINSVEKYGHYPIEVDKL
jgi:uroporphyrinogen-III decarboxylase